MESYMIATRLWAKRISLLVTFTAGLGAADFTFFTTMQAGLFGPGSWELGAGSTAATTESRVAFGYDPTSALPHWRPGDLPQSFEIGYRQSTNRGFVTVFDTNGTPVTASYTNPGAALSPTATWTIPAVAFLATASALFQPTSITLENLSISSGVQVLSGSLPSSIGASYSGFGPPVTNSLASPIVINPSSAGGDWTISGTIRFSGLFGSGGFGFGDQVRFGLGATGADTATPETSSALLIGGGLIALGCLRHRRKQTPIPMENT